MSPGILIVLALLVFALVAFVTEVFAIEVTALAVLGALIVSGLVTPEQAFAGFSNPAVIAIASLFVLSDALTRTGLIERAAEALGHWARSRRWLGIGVLLLTVAVLSGFLNNTAIVAIFIPLVMKLCNRLGLSPSRVLIPLSYASIFGGVLTLIGTSTNLLVSSMAQQAGQPPIGMFELSPLAVILLVVGLGYVLVFAPRLLPERVEPGDRTDSYGLGAYLTEVRVVAGSPLIASSCQQMGIGKAYDLNVLAVLRGERRFVDTAGTLLLAEGDVLIVQGSVDELFRVRRELGVSLLPDVKLSVRELSGDGVVTTELLVVPHSSLVGRTLAQVDFRRRFGGFVMAVRHHSEVVRERIAHAVLRPWDALLVVVTQRELTGLRRSNEVIVLGELPVSMQRRRRAWWLVLLVLPAVAATAAAGWLDIAPAALLGALLLALARAVRPREAYDAIDWSVIIMIAAFVPVGQAIVDTGTADLLAGALVGIARHLPVALPYALLSMLYLATSLSTQIISNAAAAIILTPVSLSLAAGAGVDPRPFVIAVCFAASAEFMTPVGYQTNLMVYSPGAYRFLDYTRFGAPLNLLYWLLASLLIPVFWPF